MHKRIFIGLFLSIVVPQYFDLFGFYALYGTFFRRTGHRPNSSVHLNIAFFCCAFIVAKQQRHF